MRRQTRDYFLAAVSHSTVLTRNRSSLKYWYHKKPHKVRNKPRLADWPVTSLYVCTHTEDKLRHACYIKFSSSSWYPGQESVTVPFGLDLTSKANYFRVPTSILIWSNTFVQMKTVVICNLLRDLEVVTNWLTRLCYGCFPQQIREHLTSLPCMSINKMASTGKP